MFRGSPPQENSHAPKVASLSQGDSRVTHYMSQVTSARAAHDLYSTHAVGGVNVCHHRPLVALVEGRPPAAAAKQKSATE